MNRLIPGNKNNVTLLVIYDVFGGFHFILLRMEEFLEAISNYKLDDKYWQMIMRIPTPAF